MQYNDDDDDDDDDTVFPGIWPKYSKRLNNWAEHQSQSMVWKAHCCSAASFTVVEWASFFGKNGLECASLFAKDGLECASLFASDGFECASMFGRDG